MYKYNIMQRTRQILYQRCTYTIYAVERRGTAFICQVYTDKVYIDYRL